MTDKREELRKGFPKEAYKEVKFGRGFTSIDAYHVIERLNDVFGLDGWSVEVSEWVVSGASVACVGTLYAKPTSKDAEKPNYTIIRQAVGDGTVIKGNVAEAYKKAFTNLICKSASYIEIGIDVYQGKHQDDPYLDKVEQNSPRASKNDDII